MNISTALAGLSAIQKLLPVIDAIGQEIGPVIQKELVDGKVVWSDVEKCYEDLSGAFEAVKAAAAGAAPEA